MGVPQLAGYINDEFKDCIVEILNGRPTVLQVDYIYFDANPILHNISQYVFGYGEFSKPRPLCPFNKLTEEEKIKKVYELFFKKIIKIMSIIVPKKLIYIAIDGPAPLAKQYQQSQRRLNSVREKLIKEKTDSKVNNTFDSTCITPGTPFMFELTKYINFAIRQYLNSIKSNIEIYFSSPTVPGEGEHKILEFIRSLYEREDAYQILNNQRHCIYGPDGDLIMLSLATKIKSMTLLREKFGGNVDDYTLLDIEEISKRLPEKMSLSISIKEKLRTIQDIKNDFIFLGFFLGNDFLPRIRMFLMLKDGINQMLRMYYTSTGCGTRNFITMGKAIDFKNFFLFLNELNKIEGRSLLNQSDYHYQQEDQCLVNHTLLAHIFRDQNEKKQLDFSGYRFAYYRKVFSNLEHSTNFNFNAEIENMCLQYIRGLYWNYEYYTNGLTSWNFIYPYHYAPLMYDLTNFSQKIINSKDFPNIFNNIITKFDYGEPTPPFLQLLYVLPSCKYNYLPSPYHSLMIDPDSPLNQKKIYQDPLTIKFDMEGFAKKHMAIIIIPFIDTKFVETEYRKIICEYNYKRNEIGKLTKFSRSNNKIYTFISDYGTIKECRIEKIEID
jgi:5'-3' exonuclease